LKIRERARCFVTIRVSGRSFAAGARLSAARASARARVSRPPDRMSVSALLAVR
jgi:hypothetical protein